MGLMKKQIGFTIVETMIVFAITGALLLATVLLVTGQVQRYSFRESSINFEQVLAGAINDTRVGYFAPVEDAGLACGDVAGDTTAGNSDCVYIGKKITVDGGNRLLKSEPNYINDSENPFVNFSGIKSLSATTTERSLPTGLDFASGETSFYVLFSKYGTNVGKGGEGQAVAIYETDGASLVRPTSHIAIKASNGNRKVVYCLGKSGNPTVKKEFQEDCSP